MLPLDLRLGKVCSRSLGWGHTDLDRSDAGAWIDSQVPEPCSYHSCKSILEALVRQPLGKARSGHSV